MDIHYSRNLWCFGYSDYLESNGWEGAVGEDEDMNLIEGTSPVTVSVPDSE
jgi:hypothetical protein